MIKYRTEKLYGEGYRDAAQVMAYEVLELFNTDIIVTLSKTIASNNPELQRILGIIDFELSTMASDYLDTDGKIFDIVQNYDSDSKEAVSLFEKVLQEVNKATGKNIKYVLWLCDSKEDLYKNYNDDGNLTDDDIDEYEDSDVILSDLGGDGKLYGYEELPIPINR